MTRFLSYCLAIFAVLFSSCKSEPDALPVLGEPAIIDNKKVYPRVAHFDFINQDSNRITNANFEDKIYIADFIFLSCPTICPVMTRELKKVYDMYRSDDRVLFLSHTIDPERDSIPRLNAYAKALGVSSSKWHFVTGNQDSMINLAEKSYYSAAYADSTAPGGFVHSGGFLLIDKNRHIRGVYNSLDPKETSRLMNDMKRLLREQF